MVDSLFSIVMTEPRAFRSRMPVEATSELTPVIPERALIAWLASCKFVDEKLKTSVTDPLIKSLVGSLFVLTDENRASV